MFYQSACELRDVEKILLLNDILALRPSSGYFMWGHFTALFIHFLSLVPRLSTRLHRKYGGRGGEKEREPGTNRSRMREFNCRKHVRTEGNDAGRR